MFGGTGGRKVSGGGPAAFHEPKYLLYDGLCRLRRHFAYDDHCGQIGPEDRMVVIEHILKGERRYSIRRRLSEGRIALREEGRSQGPPGEIVGTLELPRHRGGDLLPDES